jgi:hypothetical protein
MQEDKKGGTVDRDRAIQEYGIAVPDGPVGLGETGY